MTDQPPPEHDDREQREAVRALFGTPAPTDSTTTEEQQ